ncbi:MAG: nicotinate-nucleotide adenylyltransferase [Eubacteriaceae bacterium]|nr:nicotinate-nucleotide adenylyltransferase [Eubacteriaceae bacterium]
MSTTDRKKRTGILGGSFNPIHNAHLALCEYAREALGLDRVILIPTGDSPFKDYGKVSRTDRYRMTLLASEDLEGYEVSDIEINRPGQSYTYDTLRELPREENEEFYFITGSDILMQLRYWNRSDGLFELTRFAVALRRNTDNTGCLAEAERLFSEHGAGIVLMQDSSPEGISSTMIRELIASGGDPEGLVPQKVLAYIREKGLYS